jgi:predicted nucleic acid-binding protein
LIHFDTNALIALPLWSRSGHPVVARVVAGEAAAACAVVWYEFLAGPLVGSEAKMARAFLQGRIVAVAEADAALAAELFNAAGRKRLSRTDALIAAMAIRAGAEFATINSADFEPFVPHGLRLLAAD